MKLLNRTLGIVTLLCVVTAIPIRAQVSAVPQVITFQGRLATPGGTPVTDGVYNVRFSLWNIASGGTATANEKYNKTVAAVAVRNGTFAVALDAFPAGIFNGNLWLEIKIGTSAPLAPRTPLVTVPYAFKSDLALTVPDGSITNAKIVSVDWSKILNAPAGNFSLPYVGVHNDPATIAFTLRAKANAIAAYGTIRNAPTIYAENSTPGSIGYLTGNNFGAYGFSPAGAGVYGTSSGGNGVEGHTSLSYNSGVFGSADTNLAFGVTGKHFGTNNVGYLGTANAGVYGDALNAQSNGVWGHAINAFNAVYGVNEGTGNGVQGASTSGYGVYATTNSATRAGGYFKNLAGGAALIVDGTAKISVMEITGGADLAEKFDTQGKVQPGMVVAIDPAHEGKLCLSEGAYNTRVAGIVSGAGKLPAGVVLAEPNAHPDSSPIAMSGRVWVWCDATETVVEPGSFLTTAERPGYAMPVVDKARAQGAILGKAMTRLEKGKVGLVLILVNLQ